MFIRHKLAVVVLLLVAALGAALLLVERGGSDAIHVAVVGPFSGKSQAIGKSMLHGAQILVEDINARGGIGGIPVVLDAHDDRNDKTHAREIADRLGREGPPVAVIGHNFSSVSMAAGEFYRAHGLPAISPSSTNVSVTRDNPWYFRTVFNDQIQASFLANYVVNVLGHHRVAIITEDLAYGSYLGKVFGETVAKFGGVVVDTLPFTVDDEQLDRRLDAIVARLGVLQDYDAIFMATHESEGRKLVMRIKDMGIEIPVIAPDAFDSKSFIAGFGDEPNERKHPGHYTDGLYITTPMIFDTANQVGQLYHDRYIKRHRQLPDWRSAFSHDAMLLIANALEATHDGNLPLAERRSRLRDHLAGIDSPAKAIIGVTGTNFFDQHGDMPKPIAIGVYKRNNVISALVQLQNVNNPDNIPNLAEAVANEDILKIGNRYMYRTSVVYTGIALHGISKINTTDMTYELDFNLWFRYQGELDVGDIEFSNAVVPITLGEPLEVSRIGEINYRLYRVTGRFKADFNIPAATFGRHNFGIQFQHRSLSRNNLIFVADQLGMNIDENNSLARILRESKVLNENSGWGVLDAIIYQEAVARSALGHPEHVDLDAGMRTFSNFTLSMQVQENALTLRGLFAGNYVAYIAATSLLLFLFLAYVPRVSRLRHFQRSIWLLQLGNVVALLLCGEIVMANLLVGDVTPYYLEQVTTLFDIAWWLVPAYFLIRAVEIFVWSPVERRVQRQIPNLVRNFSAIIVFTLATLGILAFVFDQKITSLLATSGMVAMIIGLAIQINISNIFSGIAINMERPFRIGDWVKIGEFEEGRVVDITWRSTRLRTWDDATLNVPNSTAAESVIHNHNDPTETAWIWLQVKIENHHRPQRVRSVLLDAIRATPGIQPEPSPRVYVKMNDVCTGYTLAFSIPDFADRHELESRVWMQVWNALDIAGIELYDDNKMFVYPAEEGGREPRREASHLLGQVGVLGESASA